MHEQSNVKAAICRDRAAHFVNQFAAARSPIHGREIR